jgi:hypothetical protein
MTYKGLTLNEFIKLLDSVNALEVNAVLVEGLYNVVVGRTYEV